MKASTLKRLEALEAAIIPDIVLLLKLVNVLQFPDVDRIAFWVGDDSVLDRYAPVVHDLQPGTISKVVISLNAGSREAWEQTRHMIEAERELWDENRIREDARISAEPVPEPTTGGQFDQWGTRFLEATGTRFF